MNQILLALAFQDAAPVDSQMWIILAVVLVILFFIVIIVAVGLVVFFIMRKKRKALAAAAAPDASLAAGPGASAYAGMSQPDASYDAMPQPEPSYASSQPEPTYGASQPETSYGPQPETSYGASQPETSYGAMAQPQPAYTASSAEAVTLDPDLAPPVVDSPAPYDYSPRAASDAATEQFDPSRTVAIIREATAPISYGSIKFVSGVLAGQQFDVEPEGAYIGRERTLSQIVVSDPRISKRHLWIGARDGVVKIIDQDSRNGTFLNDPKSERVTEAVLNSGDTVIMGESDVARFEYRG